MKIAKITLKQLIEEEVAKLLIEQQHFQEKATEDNWEWESPPDETHYEWESPDEDENKSWSFKFPGSEQAGGREPIGADQLGALGDFMGGDFMRFGRRGPAPGKQRVAGQSPGWLQPGSTGQGKVDPRAGMDWVERMMGQMHKNRRDPYEEISKLNAALGGFGGGDTKEDNWLSGVVNQAMQQVPAIWQLMNDAED